MIAESIDQKHYFEFFSLMCESHVQSEDYSKIIGSEDTDPWFNVLSNLFYRFILRQCVVYTG